MVCIQNLSESFILGFEHFLQNQLNLPLFIDDVIRDNVDLLNVALNKIIENLQHHVIQKNGTLTIHDHIYLSTFLHTVFSKSLYDELFEYWYQFRIEFSLANIEFFKFKYFNSILSVTQRKTLEFEIVKKYIEQSISLIGDIYSNINDAEKSEVLRSSMRNNQIFFADELLD